MQPPHPKLLEVTLLTCRCKKHRLAVILDSVPSWPPSPLEVLALSVALGAGL